MDFALRPATLAALRTFRSRHHSLLRRRGLLIALVIALLSLAALALLDRAWLLPDIARPWLSVLAYGAAFFLAWKLAVRFVSLTRSDTDAARAAEGIAPELHEKLLAAVELSAATECTDSPEFRARLQDEVGTIAQGIDFRARQPATALWPWAKRLALGAALCAGLAFVPRLHFPGFLARAALPFANLPRPSSVVITIDRPLATLTAAPIGSEVLIEATITGEPVNAALLEYGEPGGHTSRMELTQLSAQRFETKLPVGQSDVQFRVHASDGISEWHTLQAKARPRIEQFVKTIVPPAYVGGQPLAAITEDHGDIEALAGSTVRLAMRSNQGVTDASIVLNPDLTSHPEAPAMAVKDGTQLTATLPIDGKAEAWTVKLKATDTGFTNDESTAWRITAVPDLPPIVQLTEPAEPQLSRLTGESLRLVATASDDVGLARASISQSVNGEPATETPLAVTPKSLEVTLQHLFQIQLKAGDTVLLKVIAEDLKGQKSESNALRLLILEETIDPKQRQWAAEQQRLAQVAKSLEERTRDLIKDASNVQKVQKSKDTKSDEAASKLAKFQQSLASTKEQADELWEQLKRAAQAAPTAPAAQEAQLLGEQVAKLRSSAIDHLEDLTKDGTVEHTEAVKRAASEANNAASTVENAAKSFAARTAAAIAQTAARQLTRQQQQLTQSALQANRDTTQRPKWQEQQRAALAATADVKADMEALKETLDGQQSSIDRMSKEVAETVNDLRDSLDQPKQENAKTPEHLYGAADNLRNRLNRNADALRSIAEDADRRAAQARERLGNIDNPALVDLDQAEQQLNVAAQQAKNDKKKVKENKEGQTPQEEATSQLARAAKQLQDQAELREQNPLTNTDTALDTNRASRAAQKLAQEAAKAEDAAALEAARDQTKALRNIARVLQAEATTNEAIEAIAEAQMQSAETKDKADAAQQSADQLKRLPHMLRRSDQPNELANAAQQAEGQARAGAQQLKDQAREQAQNPQAPKRDTPTALAMAKEQADKVAAALAPKAAAAREQLTALAPKLSEMLQEVASELNETKESTEAAKADADAEKPVADVAAQAQNLQGEAAENSEAMQALQAALRQEANAAELSEENNRQLARTADVALESMRQQTPAIQANLKQAAQAQASQPQSTALGKAAEAQQKTAEALQQLAQNFAKMEAGEAVTAEQLAAMAKLEQDLGVQKPLDEAYNQAKTLAEITEAAKTDPQKALTDLESALEKNQAMQKSLADIASTTADDKEAALAENADKPTLLSMTAADAATDLARVGRHQARLREQPAAQKVAQASEALAATAKATKTDLSQATPATSAAAKQAAATAAEAAQQTAQATSDPANIDDLQKAEANALASALDALDKQLNPTGEAQQPQQSQQGQQGQQGQQSQQQQGAQQSMAQAQQSNQQSMAQSRAQGQVPGQQKGQQQSAQASAQQGAATSAEGNVDAAAKNGQVVTVEVANVGLINVADWGKLPARMAEDLSEATRQEAAPEYRAAIENYYKAIADRAKR